MNPTDQWVPSQDNKFLFEDDFFKQAMMLGLENSGTQFISSDIQQRDHKIPVIQSVFIKSEDVDAKQHPITVKQEPAINIHHNTQKSNEFAEQLARLHRRVSSDPIPKIESMDLENLRPALNRLTTSDFFFGPELASEILSANPFASPAVTDEREMFSVPALHTPPPTSPSSFLPKTGLKRNLSEPSLSKNEKGNRLYKDVLGISDNSDNESCSEDEYIQFLSESFVHDIQPHKKMFPNPQIKIEDTTHNFAKITPRPMHHPTPQPNAPSPMDTGDEQRGCLQMTCNLLCAPRPLQPPAAPTNTAPGRKAFKRGPVTKCQFPNCTKWCTYGYDGQKPMFCKPHMLPGMVDMASRRCCFDGCRKSSSFAFKGQQPKYCRTHMEPGMVNVVSRQCEQDGCTSQPGFGFEGQKPKFCGKHKEPGMLYIRNKCVTKGCGKTKKFGHVGGKPTHCRVHASEGMVSCVKKRKCDFPGCASTPSFTTTHNNIKARFCAKHKCDGMVTILAMHTGNLK